MGEKGTLEVNEPHPAAYNAREWIGEIPFFGLAKWQESFSSCAIDGNRLAEVCSETLRRIINNEPVSDRYLLGLVWTMKSLIDLKLPQVLDVIRKDISD